MNRYPGSMLRALVVLAALLALPIAQTASPVEAKKRMRTMTKTFDSGGSWSVGQSAVSPISASPYPFGIDARGLKGTIRDVNVSLAFVNHDNPDDLEVLLVGPRGQTAIVMADVGGEADVDSVTLTFDDEAPAPLPDNGPLQSGAYRPTNAEGNPIAFNVPAPTASANAALSVFDGSAPNGTWRLFIQDDVASINPGFSANGWFLEITTQFNKNKRKTKKRDARPARETDRRPAIERQAPVAVS